MSNLAMRFTSKLTARAYHYCWKRKFVSATTPLFEKKVMKVPTMGDSISEVCLYVSGLVKRPMMVFVLIH
jgi:hypothetical protein